MTVTGAGGSGKTRLAVELARSVVSRFERGVWLVELGQLEDPALVVSAAAGVLGVRQQPGRSIDESVALTLADRHVLLVLDNCEHVIDAAAGLCERMLRASGDLRILATSREPLGVEGEARFACPPLPIGPADGLAPPGEAGAADLFAERARQIDAGFALTGRTEPLVAALVRRLDGMPLAVELAAAQLDALTLEQLLGDLDGSVRVLVSPVRGVAARQASLEASIEWSYRLLDRVEQVAFRRLSVFPASFSRAAAVAACPDLPALPGLLARLVRRSMVLPPAPGPDSQPRYGILDTLRTYGRARLAEAGEAAEVRAAVTGWAVTEAERAAEGFEREATELAAARWVDAEQDNLREIMGWARTADPVAGLRLACALGPWWQLRGRFHEGQALLEAVLDACAAPPVAAQAAAEMWIGRFAEATGDVGRSWAMLERAARRAGQHGLGRELAASLNSQVSVLINTGRLEEARAVALRGLAVARAAGYATGEAWAAGMLSINSMCRGDRAGALAWARESAAVPADQIMGETARKRALVLANALADAGDLDGADAALQEGLERCRAAGSRDDVAGHLLALGRLETRQSRPELAAGHLAEAMGLYAETGDRRMLVDCLVTAAACAAPRALEAALTLFGAATALAGALQLRLDSDASTAELIAAPLAAARRHLGEARAGQAEARGVGMPLVAALDFAREVLRQGTGAPGSTPGAALTPRERELVDLLAEGLTDQQIAQKLFISVRTVRSHLDRIRDKTGARRRADLTRLALGKPSPPRST
ncbi:MAG TPA: LuxR C-terminal-related transcriptional regulator [Streptosporangiaceae bacterium]